MFNFSMVTFFFQEFHLKTSERAAQHGSAAFKSTTPSNHSDKVVGLGCMNASLTLIFNASYVERMPVIGKDCYKCTLYFVPCHLFVGVSTSKLAAIHGGVSSMTFRMSS